MQQRRPRLGDVLDDYCPRERRITNHVVVAMIEDAIKQTRCTTCDGDHDYKQGRTPSPRKPKAVAAIQDGAESFEPKPTLAAPVRVPDAPSDGDGDDLPASIGPTEFADTIDASAPLAANAAAQSDEPLEDGPREDEGPVHRRLIRATLPRPEGHVPERKEPEFTIRQQGSQGGGREVDGNSVGYRQKGPRQGGGFGGHSGGHSRFGGPRHGSGQQRQGQGGARGPNTGQRGGRPDGAGGAGNPRGQRQGPGPGPGSGRRRGGR
jgi:hypothetical protein